MLDAKDGRIVGAPSQYGAFNFSVRVTDSDSPPLSDVQHYCLNIDRACGDADGNGNVNISDVTFLINFLYKEGMPPDPEEIGDADGSGVINLLDVTHLINYLYRDGPTPIC